MQDTALKPARFAAAIAMLCCLWAGVVIGVSFIATVAKFGAPSLTLPVALEVGKYTFAPLARTEWVLALLLAVLVLAAGFDRIRAIVFAALAAILFTQAMWLLPALDARVDAIIAGNTPPPSRLHVAFVAAEGAKLLLLFGLALREARRLRLPAA